MHTEKANAKTQMIFLNVLPQNKGKFWQYIFSTVCLQQRRFILTDRLQKLHFTYFRHCLLLVYKNSLDIVSKLEFLTEKLSLNDVNLQLLFFPDLNVPFKLPKANTNLRKRMLPLMFAVIHWQYNEELKIFEEHISQWYRLSHSQWLNVNKPLYGTFPVQLPHWWQIISCLFGLCTV